MRYHIDNIVLLVDNRTVQIMAINEEENKYQVFDVDSTSDVFFISESEIVMLIA